MLRLLVIGHPRRQGLSPSISLVRHRCGNVDAAIEIAGAELRGDVFANDASASGVGNRALQSAADFDAYVMIVFRDQQQDAIVDAFASELPGIDHANGILLDLFGLVATISTAICDPLRCSSVASSDSSACFCCASSVPVASVTRAVNAGIGCRPSAATATASVSATPARIAARVRSGRNAFRDGFGGGAAGAGLLKSTLGGRRIASAVDREGGLGLVAEHHRREILREAAHEHVVFLHRRDEAVARHGNAILGAFQLRLQILGTAVGSRRLDDSSSSIPPSGAKSRWIPPSMRRLNRVSAFPLRRTDHRPKA